MLIDFPRSPRTLALGLSPCRATGKPDILDTKIFHILQNNLLVPEIVWRIWELARASKNSLHCPPGRPAPSRPQMALAGALADHKSPPDWLPWGSGEMSPHSASSGQLPGWDHPVTSGPSHQRPCWCSQPQAYTTVPSLPTAMATHCDTQTNHTHSRPKRLLYYAPITPLYTLKSFQIFCLNVLAAPTPAPRFLLNLLLVPGA